MENVFSVEVLPEISDHRLVHAKVNLSAPESIDTPRDEWVYAKANWHALNRSLMQIDWNSLF